MNNSFVKSLATANLCQREVVGAKVFSNLCKVAQVKRVGTKSVLVEWVTGVQGDKVNQKSLNKHIIDLFKKINQSRIYPDFEFDISHLINELIEYYADSRNVVTFLKALLERSTLWKRFPVHGDLQKQNLFINKNNKLILIDFEHFCFGPQELELANSLYHHDTNCLDLNYVVPFLMEAKIINYNLLKDMLYLYYLKEIAQGEPLTIATPKLHEGLNLLKPTNTRGLSFSALKTAANYSSCRWAS